MSAGIKQEVNEVPVNSVMEILSLEIRGIASEIETLQLCSCGQITHEQMMQMQKIDFCSQRLAQVSILVRHLAKLEKDRKENLHEELRNEANLEHVRDLFA